MLTCRAATPEEADAPRRADASQGPPVAGGRRPGSGPTRGGAIAGAAPGRARRAVRDGLGVAPPRPGAPTRTAAEATVSNDTSTLSCGFSPLHLEHSFP